MRDYSEEAYEMFRDDGPEPPPLHHCAHCDELHHEEGMHCCEECDTWSCQPFALDQFNELCDVCEEKRRAKEISDGPSDAQLEAFNRVGDTDTNRQAMRDAGRIA